MNQPADICGGRRFFSTDALPGMYIYTYTKRFDASVNVIKISKPADICGGGRGCATSGCPWQKTPLRRGRSGQDVC